MEIMPNILIDIQHEMHTSEGKVMMEVCAEIPCQELLCIFGHSGAGKTTLLRIIAGLTTPHAGTIKVDDEVWFDSTRKINVIPQRRNIGFVFQDYALFPNMSIAEHLKYAQKLPNKAEVDELLCLFELEQLSDRKPHQLSGGQKQRVALARALAYKPNILLLDEPLSALDYEMRLELRSEIIKSHLHLGSTTLMVSHDIPEINELATQVMVLKGGKMVKMDTPNEVFKSHAHYRPLQ
jgi:molybdate transport system ATP-binding protein